MRRTQIYIDEDIFNSLERESQIEKKSISEIIRESIRERVSFRRSETLQKMNLIFGIWKNRKMNVDKYVRNIRKDRKLW